MTDFNSNIDRLSTESVKWRVYPPDVLPMWVADMDFLSPEPVIRALHERVDHGVFGYGIVPQELKDVFHARLHDRYGWDVAEEALVFIPGVVTGFNIACRSAAEPGAGLLIQTPVYPPIVGAAGTSGMEQQVSELIRGSDGRYIIDWDAFRAAIQQNTRSFLLCNPHNPVGRVYTQNELETMAEICLKRGLTIISDEIHCDLVYSGHRHVPIASLSPEIEAHTITLMAPSKTFNIAGLECSVAIIPNAELRKKYLLSNCGMVHGVNILGLTAALAAYRDSEEWYHDLMIYLEANRDEMVQFVKEKMPSISTFSPEGTYLAWFDCHNAGIDGNPYAFFLEQAKVAVNDGAEFGKGGEGFIRFNFGTSRGRMMEALGRMATALKNR
jgi:cystathionine beta-lyase